MKTAYSETYRISKTFDAPLDFVYGWCTDFREDDPKMLGSKLRRNFFEKTPERVIWTITGEELPTKTDPVRAVWLRPPDAWHLETCGDEVLVGDYKLTAIGKEKTRLDLTLTKTYSRKKDVRDRKTFQAGTLDHWDHYGGYLERDYKKARGP